MALNQFALLDDEQLADLLYTSEDRLPLEAAREIASRDGLLPFLAEVVRDKQSWLTELPEWWAVVHSTYILAMRGGEEVVLPLLSALRWADAFDCDWVTELMPSMLGKQGPAVIPGLTAVVRDPTAGWSARDLAMKGLAAVSLSHPDSETHVFRIIGERFMDEGEDRAVRYMAAQILLDFRRQEYRLPLLRYARQQSSFSVLSPWWDTALDPEEVEWSFRQAEPELWHYQEDWTRFYDPGEIQRRQKRWSRERLGAGQGARERNLSGSARILPLWRHGKKPEPPADPDRGE